MIESQVNRLLETLLQTEDQHYTLIYFTSPLPLKDDRKFQFSRRQWVVVNIDHHMTLLSYVIISKPSIFKNISFSTTENIVMKSAYVAELILKGV